MLEIIILVLCGRHIASIAKRKNRSPVGYVILMVLGWYGGAIAAGIVGAIIGAAAQANQDEVMIYILPLAIVGALSGLGVAYLVVCSVSPRAKDPEYEDYDDYERPRRRRRDEIEDDDYDRPRSRRRDDDDFYDDDRPRRRRREDDD